VEITMTVPGAIDSHRAAGHDRRSQVLSVQVPYSMLKRAALYRSGAQFPRQSGLDPDTVKLAKTAWETHHGRCADPHGIDRRLESWQ